jgi:hypothetical protein
MATAPITQASAVLPASGTATAVIIPIQDFEVTAQRVNSVTHERIFTVAFEFGGSEGRKEVDVTLKSSDMTNAFMILQVYADHIKDKHLNVAQFSTLTAKFSPVLITRTSEKNDYSLKFREYDKRADDFKEAHITGSITGAKFKALQRYAEVYERSTPNPAPTDAAVTPSVRLVQTSAGAATTFDVRVNRGLHPEWARHKATFAKLNETTKIDLGELRPALNFLEQQYGNGFQDAVAARIGEGSWLSSNAEILHALQQEVVSATQFRNDGTVYDIQGRNDLEKFTNAVEWYMRQPAAPVVTAPPAPEGPAVPVVSGLDKVQIKQDWIKHRKTLEKLGNADNITTAEMISARQFLDKIYGPTFTAKVNEELMRNHLFIPGTRDFSRQSIAKELVNGIVRKYQETNPGFTYTAIDNPVENTARLIRAIERSIGTIA